MEDFKFNYVSYDKILTSIKGKDMIEAIDQPFDEHLLVTGLPGCGKSTIATHRLDRLRKKEGIFFTYGKLLQAYIIQGLENEESKIKVVSFWKWFYDFRKKCKLNFLNIKSITNEDIKITFENFLLTRGGKKLDFVIIDEGQDFHKGVYENLNIIAEHISVFADDAQQIFLKQENANIEYIINTIDPVHYILNINRRNPRGLYEFSLALNPKNVDTGKLKLMTNKLDPVEVYNCVDKGVEMEKILDILEEYKGKNIGILFGGKESAKKFLQEISNKGIIVSYYDSDIKNVDKKLRTPIITTFFSVKGLEFDIVIIPGLYPENINLKLENNHFFVAFTRASDKLIITHHNGDSEIERKLKHIDKNLYEEYKFGFERDKNKYTNTLEEEISIEDIPF